MDYFEKNKQSNYNIILKNILEFNDYIDYMPRGSISRKLKIITEEYSLTINRKNLIFFTNQEINNFVHNTCEIVRNKIIDKNAW